ncbi:MAG TPA: hypothetical protein DCS93_34655 [Microscillaceae bacterium]|nr:hypothetical protein [Microscillaceae bacterium]
MKNTEAVKILTKIRQKWQWLKVLELLLWSVGTGVLTMALLKLVFDPGNILLVILGSLFSLLIFGIALERLGVRKIQLRDVAQFLNRNYPALENSTELVLTPRQDLTLVAKMQQNKVNDQLQAVASQVKIPHQLTKSAIALLIGLGLAFALFSIHITSNTLAVDKDSKQVPSKLATTPLPKSIPAEIQKVTATIHPPAYTGLGTQIASDLNLKAPENSQIHWQVKFKGAVKEAFVVLNDGDSLRLQPNAKAGYIAQWLLKEKGFYQIVFKPASTPNTWKTSDFFALEPIRDARPKLTITGINENETFLYRPSIDISFKTRIVDDYRITDAYIVATVSKGQGESVKFREQKLRFGNFVPGRRNYQLQKTLNLQKLGMAPGDELYFFVEAIDNKTPRRQKGRTEVYFVAIQDTTSEQLSISLGTGIKKLPDYFRSQRQLIIDTEKLLKRRSVMPLDSFHFKSNGIGVDQKILRLRYGKFLGEEYEVSMGSGGHSGHDHHGHDHGKKDPNKDDNKKEPKRDTVRYRDIKTGKMVTEVHYEGDGHGDHDYGHKKWKLKISSFGILRRNEKDHNHKPKSAAPSNNPMDYVPEDVQHIHDIMEEATFFDEVLKKQLRQALRNMWESELRLRTNRPKESLPFQYKALKLIKQIQQKSRVYVERIGFEPPPIKEKEKRLKGELEEVQNPYKSRSAEVTIKYPNIREILPVLEGIRAELNPKKPVLTLTKNQRRLLRAAGSELAEIAIDRPGQFLTGLQTIQQLSQGKVLAQDLPEVLTYLIKTLWQALPQDRPQPSSRAQAKNRLLELYLQKIGQ